MKYSHDDCGSKKAGAKGLSLVALGEGFERQSAATQWLPEHKIPRKHRSNNLVRCVASCFRNVKFMNIKHNALIRHLTGIATKRLVIALLMFSLTLVSNAGICC
jgi:hypothetical protein